MPAYMLDRFDILFDDGSKAIQWFMMIRQSGAEVSSMDSRRERVVLDSIGLLPNRLT